MKKTVPIPHWARYISQDPNGDIYVWSEKPDKWDEWLSDFVNFRFIAHGNPNPQWKKYCRKLTYAERTACKVLIRIRKKEKP